MPPQVNGLGFVRLYIAYIVWIEVYTTICSMSRKKMSNSHKIFKIGTVNLSVSNLVSN